MKKIVLLSCICLLTEYFSIPATAQRNKRQSIALQADTGPMESEIKRTPIIGLGKPYADRIALRWTAGKCRYLPRVNSRWSFY